MRFKKLEFKLKDGRNALLRSPTENDAESALEFFQKASGETDFLLFSQEEALQQTLERERQILQNHLDDQNGEMISCFVNGKFVGNCDIRFDPKLKTRHRVQVGIAILKEYWNLGIGSKMFEAIENEALQNEYVSQIELCFIEGNKRARHLYEKVGFRIVGVQPNAVKLSDGKFYNEYLMIKQLR